MTAYQVHLRALRKYPLTSKLAEALPLSSVHCIATWQGEKSEYRTTIRSSRNKNVFEWGSRMSAGRP
eukprot:1153929-Pelagomonas_calceolata.AAC.5